LGAVYDDVVEEGVFGALGAPTRRREQKHPKRLEHGWKSGEEKSKEKTQALHSHCMAAPEKKKLRAPNPPAE